jgi:glycosyltransferase involved in cell wall biosynthesis
MQALHGLIDLYKVKDLYSGLGQFSLHLGMELAAEPKGIQFDFLLPDVASAKLFPANASVNFVKAGFQKRYLPGMNPDYDFWHCTQQFPSHLPKKGTPMMLTVHDLNFLVDKPKSKAAQYLKRLQQNVDRAQIITAISEFSKKEIEQHIDLKGKKVEVVYNGVSSTTAPPQQPSININKPFLFALGVFKSTKNFHVLLEMVQNMHDVQLIIAGNNQTTYGEKIKTLISENRLEEKVMLCGTVSEAEKKWLYQNCMAFLFPSIAEGFGIPLVEAMQEGKPCFISNKGSLPEIGGTCVYTFEHFDPDYMQQFFRNKLEDFKQKEQELREKMRLHVAQFEWKTCAQSYIALYQKAAALRSNP